jgi:hypothetical protein
MSRRAWRWIQNKVTCQKEFEDEYKIKLHVKKEFEDEYKIKLHVKKSLKMNTK